MRNSKLIISGAVAIGAILGIGAASAADMAVKARPIAVDPAYNWTGFYIGGNVGGAWITDDRSLVPSAGFGLPPPGAALIAASGTGRLTGSGFIGGVQAGYNYQVNSWVWGVEADIDAINIRRSNLVNLAALGVPPFAAGNTLTQTFKSDWMSTVRGRVGYAAGSWLVYATGGLAIANVQAGDFEHFFVADVNGSGSSVKTGWAVGAGLEYAFNRNWSLKGEYLHADLGSISYQAGPPILIPTSFSLDSSRFRIDTVRVGLNYRFGGPVVAKY
jgi:outer membrane immunogenic protein